MGGVVNVITKSASDVPQTNVRIAGGFYSKPIYEEWAWSDRTLAFNSMDVSHTRRIGKLDILFSGSRKQVDHGISLENQETKIRAYCTLNDFEVDECIADPGYSAKSLKRPEIEKIIQMAKNSI